MYRGDIALGQTIDIKFTSRRFTTGAPFTLAGSPVISAYVGNGTTEITAGITLTVDFDARTGLNNVRVVATSGNGFAAQTDVDLVITTGTVDSVSVVGEVIGSFSIENRSALRPTVAGRTLGVEASGKATGVVLTDTVTTYTGDTPQTGDAFARLGAPAGASVSADIAALPTATENATELLGTTLDSSWIVSEALISAAEAGAGADPWATALPGAYGAGTAGRILGRIPDLAAGAAGGVMIAGSNAATTLASLTVTGALTVSDGVIITAATTNRSGISSTGNGTGHGLNATGGATGSGIVGTGGATSGHGLAGVATASGSGLLVTGVNGSSGITATGGGSGSGIRAIGGNVGIGFRAIGGSSSGDGASFEGTAGNSRGMVITGQGSNDGLEISGGATGTGLDINGGAASGSGLTIDSVSGNAVAFTAGGGNGDALQLTGNGAGHGMNVIAGSTGNALVLTNTSSGVPFSADGQDVLALWLSAGSAGDPWSTSLPGAYGAGTAGFIVGTNIDALITSRMASYTQPTGFLAATFPAGTIANTTNITAGTITTTTNLTNLPATAALEATLTAMKGATFNGATDSLEALRDRGDAAWITATGFATHSAADVWAVTTRRLSSAGIDDILDEVVEGSFTVRQYLRGFAAAMLGKANGLETTNAKYRDTADSKDRIDAVVDTDGNRTSVTLDLT